MAVKKEIGFWDGVTPHAKSLVILGALATLAWVGSRWLIYKYPKVEIHAKTTTDKAKVVKRNVVTVTTTKQPDGTVTTTEVKDLTSTNSSELTSNLVSSLSTPVFPPGMTFFGVIEKDLTANEYIVGARFHPFEFLSFDAKTNLQLNKLILGLGVGLR